MSVTIYPVAPALPGVVFELAGLEQLAGGTGGWEVIDRPRRTAAAAWVGTPARTLTLPLLLDGLGAAGVASDTSVDPQCAAVSSWGVPHPATGKPPVVQVQGLTTVVPQEQWVVQDIGWGEYLTNGGVRVQQLLELTLLSYVEAAIVKGPAERARKRRKNKGKDKDGKGGKGGKDR